MFTKDAVRAIYEASRGIPRTSGSICENALLAGFAAQKKPVDRSIVADVCQDLDSAIDGRPLPEEDVEAEPEAARVEQEPAAMVRGIGAPEGGVPAAEPKNAVPLQKAVAPIQSAPLPEAATPGPAGLPVPPSEGLPNRIAAPPRGAATSPFETWISTCPAWTLPSRIPQASLPKLHPAEDARPDGVAPPVKPPSRSEEPSPP